MHSLRAPSFGPGGPFGLLVRVPVRPVGAPDHSPGRNPGRAGYPMRSNTGGAVHPFGPVGPVWGAYAVAPRGFAAQGFALGYGPPGLQPGRVRPIRALRPGWGAYAIRPGVSPRAMVRRPYRPLRVRAFVACRRPILPADGCRDRRRRRRAFRVSYRPRPASWDLSASRHRASSVPWAAWDLWDPSAA